MSDPRQNYSFSMTGSGRCGVITCTAGERRVDLGWEMSGVPAHDILLGPVDLREWHSPRRESIPVEEQKAILRGLREWLVAKRLRTDIDLPQAPELSRRECVSSGCSSKAITGSAYCLEHLSDGVLRT